jgi:radical SAM superfamily enzyme YgiQ (UPF0313 family)
VFVGEAEESLQDYLNKLYVSKDVLKDKIIKALPLKDFDEYPPFSTKRRFFGPIELVRGCKNRCAFCQTGRLFPCVRQRIINFAKNL